ncbi:MAG TPA: sugar transferase [Vicinamibacterales bacterium]|nr:sugar transferase [Vicinamibacterales bacterium]
MRGPVQRRRRERVLLVGLSAAEQIVKAIESRRSERYIVLGVVDDESASGCRPAGCPLLGPLCRLGEIAEQVRPDRVLIGLSERRRRTPLRALVESCVAAGIVVEDAAEFHERFTGKLAIETVTPASIVFGRRFGPSRRYQAIARGVSLVVAALGLVFLSPLLALIALAVKLDSRGPVLFEQVRVGAGARPFRLLKFRTMHPACERRSEWECDNRDRVTRVGRLLRAFRLDELVQFVNVVRGDMNLVGPRPHPLSNFELFTLVSRNLNERTGAAVAYYALRTMIRPGITGWAQVRYRYANNLEEEIEKLRYDLYYVKHMSAGLDLRILLETVKVMLFGHPTPEGTTAPRAERTAPPLALPANANQTHAA